jgi:hypothetical protein
MKLEQVMFFFDLFRQLKHSKELPESPEAQKRFNYALDKNIQALRTTLLADKEAVALISCVDYFMAEQQKIMDAHKAPEMRPLDPEEEFFTDEQLADKLKLEDAQRGKDIEKEMKDWLEAHPEYKGINQKFADYDLKLKGSWYRIKAEWMPKVQGRLFDAMVEEGIVYDESFETVPMREESVSLELPDSNPMKEVPVLSVAVSDEVKTALAVEAGDQVHAVYDNEHPVKSLDSGIQEGASTQAGL